MYIVGASPEDVRDVAREVGVAVANLEPYRKGLRVSLTLAPDKKYQRTSANAFHRGRRVHAVCFHGHYAFFVALFDRCPDAVVQTAGWGLPAVTYKRDDWEHQASALGDTDIGPPISPILYRDCCECEVGA